MHRSPRMNTSAKSHTPALNSHDDRDHHGAHSATDDSGGIFRSHRGVHRACPSCVSRRACTVPVSSGTLCEASLQSMVPAFAGRGRSGGSVGEGRGAHRGALQCAVPHGIAHLERQRSEGAGFYVDATEPRWSAAPVQAVSNAAPAPVVECIALAAVVYAAQAFEVEWIDMYVAIPEFLAVVPRSQEWSAEGTAAPAASAAPAPVAPASTVVAASTPEHIVSRWCLWWSTSHQLLH